MVYPALNCPFLIVREDVPEYRSSPGRDGSDPEGGQEETHDRRVQSPQDPPSPQGDSPSREAELDALEDLGDEIATLAAHIHAATHRLLELIAEYDHRRGWEPGGHRSCAHWLSFRTGIDLGAAREKVRTARALVGLPETSAAMARGELSFSKVRALTRVADAENESDLLELARDCTTAQLERVVRAWKRGDRQDEAERERERHERRCLSIFPDDDGMYVIRGRLTPEVGTLLMRAVEAASDVLWREDEQAGAHPCGSASTCAHGPEESRREARQRRADAVGLLAERAMSAGFGSGSGGEAPVSGTRAERYQVMLHVDSDTLDAEAEPGRSELEDGTRVAAETSRRVACDAGLVRVTHAPDGSLLDVGRRTRTIPPALRRALEVRDRGCRFPGCGLRFTDAHHVRHWADGGETSLSNCVLLCRFHHRLVHEGGWQVDWWGEGHPVFFDPRGGTHFEGRWTPPVAHHASVGSGGASERTDRASEEDGDTSEDVSAETRRHESVSDRDDGLPPGTDRVAALQRANRSHGADPDWRTAGARWKRLEDIPDEVLFRALEALA
ncbi:MAG: DUF222 domain-containing protein [Longimicrobiales bacterium]|nr:DUF222 domain-containing protein [Longimicrobiales bacterium]